MPIDVPTDPTGALGTPPASAGAVGGSGAGAVLGAVGAALPVVGSAIGALIQSGQNRKAREFAVQQYDRQRSDALADWNMQNAYNSPSAQMARLKAAGLNPNLVYGNGAAQSEAGAVRSSSAAQWSPKAPNIDLSNPVQGFLSTQVQKAQLNNLAIQQELLNEEVKNRAADTLKKLADTDTTKSNRDLIDSKVQKIGLEIGYEPSMLAATLEGKRAGVQLSLQRTQESLANTDFKIHEDERRQLINGMTYEQGLVKIAQMRNQMANATKMTAANYNERIARTNELSAMIDNIHAMTKGNDERARLLQSTPDWSDQRALDALQSLWGSLNRTFPKR